MALSDRILCGAALVLAACSAACAPGACPTDLHRACAQRGCAAQVKEAAAKDPGSLSKPDGKGNFPLTLAADKDIAAALLDAGADINAVDGSALSPLQAAIKHDRGEVVALLLSRGATVAYNDFGSVLRSAAQKGKANALKALLDSGAPADSADSSTRATPLHLAVLNDELEAARVLLAAGADPNAPLSADVKSGTGHTFDFSVHADVSANTPLGLARSGAMKELLKKNGAQ